MTEISVGLKNTIKVIKRLSDGSIDDQLKCSKLLGEKIFPYGKPKRGVDESIIRELLPTIIKFMESDNHVLQKEGADSITCITSTHDEANTQLVIDAGVIPTIKNLLPSTNTDVIISTLEAFGNIAYHFPENVIEILPTIIQCLKSEKKQVIHQAARFVYYITFAERITAIFEADGIKPLVEILESSNDAAIKYVLKALLNITSCNGEFCQRIIDFGGLQSLKKLCDRLFVTKRKDASDDFLKILEERKAIKLLAIEFIEIVTSYGEDSVDLIIKEDFIKTILQQKKVGPVSIAGVSGKNPEIKIEFINFIENIISFKPDFIPALLQDYNILSLLYNNLFSTNADLLISALTSMRNIVQLFEDKDITRQKFRECGGPTKYTKLCKHSNEEIRRLSTLIHEFVFDVKSDDDSAETSDSSSSDDSDNDQNNDFDDHPTSSSPAGAAPTESNRNDHSGRQSSFGNDTVATDDGPSRLHPKEEPPSTPQNVDIPTTSASRQTPDLPVAASTNNETAQNEMKPPVAGRLGYRSRRASNNSHVKLEAASTNNGNIRDNHSGRSTAVDSETAATADGIVRNGINPRKRLPIDAHFGNPLSRSTPAIAPALPAASTSANNGTIPNNIPLRKPSPVPQSVITLNLTNQVTHPAPAAINDIIQDETIKYFRPAECLIDQYCQKLGIQFNRDNYDSFISKIKFTQITSNSKPDKSFTANEKSGFGCFSILLTGNEDGAVKIRKQMNKKFIDFMNTFDKEKIKQITCSEVMLAEHLQTIATWLKCRILVYCNGWKKYGSWDEQNPMIPLFVLEKYENNYQIVLDLKNNYV